MSTCVHNYIVCNISVTASIIVVAVYFYLFRTKNMMRESERHLKDIIEVLSVSIFLQWNPSFSKPRTPHNYSLGCNCNRSLKSIIHFQILQSLCWGCCKQNDLRFRQMIQIKQNNKVSKKIRKNIGC